MAGRFEDLMVWQKARELSRLIDDHTGSEGFARDFGLRDQVRRAAVSNIAERFERGGETEFARFLQIAKGSCGEVRSQLYVAQDRGYLNAAAFKEASALAEEISRMLQSLRKRIRERVAAAQ